MSKRKLLKNLNALVAQELNKKVTVADLEEHARNVYEQGDLTPLQHEFYRGVLRAFELLRKNKLLKE